MSPHPRTPTLLIAIFSAPFQLIGGGEHTRAHAQPPKVSRVSDRNDRRETTPGRAPARRVRRGAAALGCPAAARPCRGEVRQGLPGAPREIRAAAPSEHPAEAAERDR